MKIKTKSIAALVTGVLVIGLWLGGLPSKQQAFRAHDFIDPAYAATVDYFLKMEGIDGESTDAAHRNEIQIESWSWGMSQTGIGTGGGGGAGKVSVHDISFSHKIDKATPKLFLATARGEHIKDVVLTVRKAGKEQQEYYKITLSDVLVSSLSQNAGGTSELPTENVTLNFTRMEIEYKAQKADGTFGSPEKAGYDVGAAKKL